MTYQWKKALRAVLAGLFITVFLGGALLAVYVVGALGGFPLYVLKAYPFFAAAVLLAVILVSSGYLGSRGKKGVLLGLLAVLIGCAVYGGMAAHDEKVATVDERGLLLERYIPFAGGSLAAGLNEEPALRLEPGRLPRLDGATALYPVYAAFVQAVYPEGNYSFKSGADGPALVACSGTAGAYERLTAGETDILFAAAPSQAQRDRAAQAGLVLHMTPIGSEAFVFFVNNRNPVTGLTVEQVQGIYSGDITNWKQVGGRNQRIRPFQRAENSGSQAALERLMAGKPLMEPEKRDRIGTMGGIIREVAGYRNYPNAIGFSFRFYAAEMAASDAIRLLSLDGVAPTRETIRDGSYPLASPFYAVTASPAGRPAPRETSPETAALLDWILSGQGQFLIEKTGYVPLH